MPKKGIIKTIESDAGKVRDFFSGTRRYDSKTDAATDVASPAAMRERKQASQGSYKGALKGGPATPSASAKAAKGRVPRY